MGELSPLAHVVQCVVGTLSEFDVCVAAAHATTITCCHNIVERV
jgi:hypothetical protein